MSVANVIDIDDIDDPRVALYRNVRDADLRGRHNVYVLESQRVIQRALGAGCKPTSMLLAPESVDVLLHDIEQFTSDVELFVAPRELMTQLSGYTVHRGALAIVPRPAPMEMPIQQFIEFLRIKSTFTMVVAEGMTNVDNMGALFRNAVAFGVDTVLLASDCCDPLFRKCIRVSMGHALSVPFAVSDHVSSDLGTLKSLLNLTIIGAETMQGSQPVWTMPDSDRIAIVFGGEGHGLSESTLRICDGIYHIPMHNAVPSVNVAVASAVCLYELRRGGRGGH